MPRLLCLPVLLFFLWLPSQLAAAEVTKQPDKVSIDFLYINANAGEAAGGHTALRLGDAVFHYQFFPDSTFLLVREPWDSFRFLYNDLHNRSIAIAALPLDLSAAIQIRNHFAELLAAQEQFFNALEQLRQEKRFVESLLAGKTDVAVDCLGFFTNTWRAVSPSDLPRYIEKTLGADFLEFTLKEVEGELYKAVAAMNQGRRPGNGFQEILALREALRVLLDNRALTDDALIPAMDKEVSLNVSEREILKAFGDHLAESLVELLRSRRPDRGTAILLQTARFLAVQSSLEKGQMLTLDPFFADVREVKLSDEDIEGGRLRILQEGLLEQSEKRRELFFKEGRHLEIAYTLMETGRARAWELEQVNGGQRRVRLLTKVTLPTRSGNVTVDTLHPDPDGVKENIQILEEEIAEKQKKSEKLYGYNLFTRNCATELIRSLNSTFTDSESGKNVLGGWMEPDSGFAFIPFLFYEQSVKAFSLQDEQFLQARRLRNLETLYAEENDLVVWLRESNTVSSTLYQPRSKDTPFLFFTDDSLLLRPLLGLVNVAYGIAHGVAGLAMLPLDGRENLNQALRGIFYSLPELTFGNIRKGSYSMGESENRL
ncbi:hypothetical protein UWK_00690 [Desulfocapsa sulfexigens DSM 10523]|uniref:DUF4105 domain-containing protein n=1 Tax=Desulfocapsa sulfexigens (strain DSM 10523 / SB164P1) TaxID=1167006 RepID=M1PBY0_DESSD|nr:hypothetical protein [Desulfocapsa sulfexigens]AGF77270.1 hypothetical protein UWK_00690 [Desulfocapsa sulfexigens DSM 10523]